MLMAVRARVGPRYEWVALCPQVYVEVEGGDLARGMTLMATLTPRLADQR